jgi:hypothetical protein
MERKELSNLELFVGFFKTEKSLIDFDKIKEHLLKSTARDIFKERRLNGVPLKWEKNIHWLYEYIKDQFMKHDSNRQIISVGEHETLISKPGELHPTINDINIYDLYGSPDYTILFPINGKATVSLFYDDNRHKDKSWYVDIETNKYIIFNSSIKYDISRNEEKENRFIIKTKAHIIY